MFAFLWKKDTVWTTVSFLPSQSTWSPEAATSCDHLLPSITASYWILTEASGQSNERSARNRRSYGEERIRVTVTSWLRPDSCWCCTRSQSESALKSIQLNVMRVNREELLRWTWRQMTNALPSHSILMSISPCEPVARDSNSSRKKAYIMTQS